MSDLSDIRKALQDAGVYARIEQLAEKVAALPQGLERLLVTIASYRTDPNVRSIGGVVAKAIEQGRLADISNPKVLHAIQHRQQVEALSDEQKLALYPGFAASRRAQLDDVKRDPVGTLYYRASDAFKGVQDPEPWARLTDTGLEVLIGLKARQEEEEEEAPKGVKTPYRARFPRQLRKQAIREYLESIK